MKSFLPVLVIALGSMVKAEGERDLIYLMKYGYMESKEGTAALQTEQGLQRKIKKAVMDFQAFAGLNQTGVVDGKTREMMETPRCGVRDIIGHGAYARRESFVVEIKLWIKPTKFLKPLSNITILYLILTDPNLVVYIEINQCSHTKVKKGWAVNKSWQF
jgi:hypothetical protein